jgi:carotenoid cleavage dioxygenase-like enzyme
VTYHRADANGELVINRPLDVPKLTMMHDFAMTANHVVFMDLPIVFDVDTAASGKHDMPFRWDDEYGARLGVLRRDDPFGEVRWFEIDPCYVFHVANAHDTADGNGIVVQAVRYPELWRNDGGFDAEGLLWSWTIDLAAGRVSERQLDDRGIEFPRIDDRLAGLPARYSVSVGKNGWVRHELATGAAQAHDLGDGGPGEAVFVPAAGAPDESNGYYLGYVYDPARDGSDLVIIDASDFAGKPVARIKLPQRVPYGFHGNWINA